jgi:DNA-binding GntR family transcriptional regulator
MYCMARRGSSETISTQVKDRLRADILGGKWAPGEKLLLLGLSERYQTSSTVVREALTRLTGDRLVELKPNRGFFVPELSLTELRDFNELRCLTEEFGIRLAIERGDLAWESEVHAAFHTLDRTPYRGHDGAERMAEEWITAHGAFHAKLLEACELPVLIDLARVLFDTTTLYRCWASTTIDGIPRDLNGEHRAILEAVTARDAELAGELLREHYTRSMHALLENGLMPEVERSQSAALARA